MRGGLGRLGLAAGVAVLVLLGLLLAILPSPGAERDGSVYSFKPEGRRALFLVAERLGFPVEAWNEAPGRLTGGATLLVLPQVPEEPPAVPAALAPADASSSAPPRTRDRAHYGRFVAAGGTLLVLGVGERVFTSLRAACALDLGALQFHDLRSGEGDLTLANGEPVRGTPPPLGSFEGGAGTVFLRDGEGRAVGVVEPFGAGRVALLALPALSFDNQHVRGTSDSALIFTRVLEALAPPGGAFERVLFDEYALGGWRPESLPALAFRPRLAWLSAHVLLVLVLLGWRSAWAGPFPRDPAPLLAASPLARARGFGRVLARAGRFDLLAGLLRANLLERWDARAGRRGASSEAASLEARLNALAGADVKRRARLAQLFGAAPRDERELVALDQELSAFEAELFTGRREASPGARSEAASA